MHDVIVIGAGPSGSVAAQILGDEKDVLILDKSDFPRDKVCGGAVTNRLIEKFDIPRSYLSDIRFCKINVGDNQTIEHEVEGVYTLNRKVLDNFLFEKAKKKSSFEKNKVIGLEQDGKKVTVKTEDGQEIESKYVILASGVKDNIMKKRCGMCFSVELPYVLEENTMKIYMGDFKGYAWIFSKKGSSSVGVGTMGKDLTILKEKMRRMLEKEHIGDISSVISNSVYTPIPNWEGKLKTGTGRILIVGDKGGFCNPLSGKGIYYSMLSGYHAANSILIAKDGKALDKYNTLCNLLEWKFELFNLLSGIVEKNTSLAYNLCKNRKLFENLVLH